MKQAMARAGDTDTQARHWASVLDTLGWALGGAVPISTDADRALVAAAAHLDRALAPSAFPAGFRARVITDPGIQRHAALVLAAAALKQEVFDHHGGDLVNCSVSLEELADSAWWRPILLCLDQFAREAA